MRFLCFGLGVISSLAVLATPQPSKATALHFSVPESAVPKKSESILIENESIGPQDSVAEAILGFLALYITPDNNTISLKMGANLQDGSNLNFDGTPTSSIISLVAGVGLRSL